jgi:putative transposase
MNRHQLRRKARSTFRTQEGWWRRGYLPHFDAPGKAQFITIRLADSLPQSLQRALHAELASMQDNAVGAQTIALEKQRRIERLLDAGYGSCSLQRPDVAKLVVSSLKFLSARGHQVLRWVIMPNHLHILILVRCDTSLAAVVRSFKGWTAAQANRITGSSGSFWYPEYFDRYIRDTAHFSKVVRYIDANPVKRAS